MSHIQKNHSGKPVSVVWLRRDLRLHDHPALARAGQEGRAVQPIFVFDTTILARFSNKQDRRLSFIAGALHHMHRQLQEKGAGIMVLHGEAEKLLPKIAQALGARAVVCEEDYEPETRKRDRAVANALEAGTEFILVKDHLLFAPDEVLKSDGTPFKVFTPYANAWRAKAKEIAGFAQDHELSRVEYADYEHSLKQLHVHHLPVLDIGEGVANTLFAIGYNEVTTDWPVEQAHEQLERFAKGPMHEYDSGRNFMAKPGTSRLSPYLRHGLVSVRKCYRAAHAQRNMGASTWINELIWRDFYAMILFHYPQTPHEEFQAPYRTLKWSDDKKLFARFAEGQTGYPVVDAAMRELLTTGYMHNRARMIVASFMTKDLLLDWRMGEEHFAQYLMDYELASNVGGWQWAASVGTDAQPWFRIFNPVLQSEKFDPHGEYIRRFVPELAYLGDNDIHEPWKKARPAAYPEPIVDHAKAREKALAFFKAQVGGA